MSTGMQIFTRIGRSMQRIYTGRTQGRLKKIPYDKVNRGTGKRYQSEVYSCRKDEAGKKLDKAAMLVCSKALGATGLAW